MLVHLVPGLPILMLLALLLMSWLPRLAKACLWLSTLSLLAFSSPPVSNLLLESLENRYQPLQSLPEDTGIILILGEGHQYRQGRPPNSMLSATSLSRVTEGIRLWKTQRDSHFVTSGVGLYGESSNAESAANFALENGVPVDLIHQFDTAHDTEEEIRLAVDLLRKQYPESNSRLLIVSSATHLARAEQLVQPFNVAYTLAPTDFLATDMPWYRLGGGNLHNSDRALHEYVGMLWLWIKRQYQAIATSP